MESLTQYFVIFPIIQRVVVVESLSRVRLFATPWTVAHQAPLSMGFSRQEYWSGLPFPSPGDLPSPGIELRSPHCRQTLYHLSHQNIYIYKTESLCYMPETNTTLKINYTSIEKILIKRKI